MKSKIMVLDDSWIDLGPCHYCGLSLMAHSEGGLAHSLPDCIKFRTKSPDIFLQDMRIDREADEVAQRN